MSESLPTPASAGRVTTGALDPTEVVLGPRPVQPSDAEETKVIVGEVLQGRHRAPRSRRRGTGPVGAAVLSATGLVAGLSLMLNHESAATTAAPEPVSAAPDRAPEEVVAAPVIAPVAATAAAPVGEGELAPPAPHEAVPASATRPAAAPAHHTAPSHEHAMSLKDWLKQLRQAGDHRKAGGYPGSGPWGPYGPGAYPGPGGDAGSWTGWPGSGEGGG